MWCGYANQPTVFRHGVEPILLVSVNIVPNIWMYVNDRRRDLGSRGCGFESRHSDQMQVWCSTVSISAFQAEGEGSNPFICSNDLYGNPFLNRL